MKEYNKSNLTLARYLRKNMTPWENKLWYQFLRTYPVKFYRQRTIGEYIDSLVKETTPPPSKLGPPPLTSGGTYSTYKINPPRKLGGLVCF